MNLKQFSCLRDICHFYPLQWGIWICLFYLHVSLSAKFYPVLTCFFSIGLMTSHVCHKSTNMAGRDVTAAMGCYGETNRYVDVKMFILCNQTDIWRSGRVFETNFSLETEFHLAFQLGKFDRLSTFYYLQIPCLTRIYLFRILYGFHLRNVNNRQCMTDANWWQ